jgi:hypothetical protein
MQASERVAEQRNEKPALAFTSLVVSLLVGARPAIARSRQRQRRSV